MQEERLREYLYSGGVCMKIPIQCCAECDGEKWNVGKYTISGKKEWTYTVLTCAKCGNAAFYMEAEP